jgi:predicted DNA-binding WGR domain protein
MRMNQCLTMNRPLLMNTWEPTMRRFELVEGKSSKFWEVGRDGSTYTVRYGRIGTQGQSLEKTAASDAQAEVEVNKLIKEKTGKGYQEVAAAGGGAPASATVKPSPKAPAAPTPKAAGADTVSTEAEPAAVTAANAPAADVVGHAPIASADAAAAEQSPPEPSGAFRWTSSWRKALPAQRGEVLSTEAPSLEALLLRLGRIAATNQQQLRWGITGHGLEPVLKRFPINTLFTIGSLELAETERWEAALQLGCVISDDQNVPALPGVIELCIHLHGIEFALRRYFAAIPQLKGAQNYFWQLSRAPGLDEFNAALAACSEADYAQIRDAVLQSEPANELERFARGAVFGAEPALVADALRVADFANTHNFISAALLSGVRLDLAQAQQLVRADALRDHVDHVRRLAVNLIRSHGEAAIPLLGELYTTQHSSPTRSLLADLLAACNHSAAFTELLAHIEHKEARGGIDEFAKAWPFAAMRAAAIRIASSRDKSLEAWLGRMLAAHPQWLPALHQGLEGAALDALRRLQDRLVNISDAPLESLPAVLRDPPWLKPQPKLARPSLPDRSLPEPCMRWPTGLREQWLKDIPSHAAADPDSNKQKGRLAQVLESLSIPPALRPGLVSGAITDLGPHLEEIERFRASRPSYYRSRAIYHLGSLAPKHRLLLWNSLPGFDSYSWDGSATAGSLLAHHELDALPGLLTYLISRLDAALQAALPLAAAAVASYAALGLAGKRSRPHAAAWLRAHTELATTALLAQVGAAGAGKKQIELAERGLRWMAVHAERARMQIGAGHFGAAGEDLLTAVIAIDPLALLPQKPRPLPTFFLPGGYARPRLHDGNGLPLQVLPALGTMLQVSLLDEPYAGLDEVKQACSADSLDAFAWDLFQSWYQSGAPSKDNWAFTAVGLLGGDQCVRLLTPLIREWPGEAQHARAVSGLDILAAIGSDLALMNLNAIANKAKFKGLQQRATDRIEAIAEARGLSPEELADRLVPDLDLDEHGTLLLDFGPRQFTVGFDEQLRPFALDASGARLKDLPKPGKSDTAELAQAASERWKLLKKDAKSIASTQLQRLEQAMCSGRSFPADVFLQFFVQHPLQRHLARRLLWGVRGTDGAVSAFRVAEDSSFADRNDDVFELPADAVICLPHLLELSAEDQAGFGQVFSDYEILQPFPQLGREVLLMSEGELAQSSCERFKGKRIATGSAYGLQHRGWRHGDAQDAGWVGWFTKQLPGGLEAQIELDPGTVVGDIQYEPKQTLGALTLRRSGSWDAAGLRPFSSLSAVARSELLRDLDRLSPLLE